MRVVYGRFGTANLTDQHELMLRALATRDVAGLKRALLTDIRDGMGLIGASGFAAAPIKDRNLGAA
jgi:DNA-binding GntR family transcriptional regulator